MEYTRLGPAHYARVEQIQSYRTWQTSLATLRDRPILHGRVVEFLTRSENPIKTAWDGRTAPEMVLPGAFGASLAGGSDIKALIAHEDQWEIGSRDEYSLELREDAEGLQYRLSFDHETKHGRLLYRAADRGHLAGMSFRFRPRGRHGVFYSDGTRVLVDVDLIEVSFILPPWRPAYRTGTAHLDVPLSVLRKRLNQLVTAAF